MNFEKAPAEEMPENKASKTPKDDNKDDKDDKEKPWADIWGETQVDFHGGKIEVTDRGTGEVTINKDKETFNFFNQLDRAEQDGVIAEVKKFENSEEVIGLSARELIMAVDEKREELAKVIIDAKKEGESKEAGV